MRRWYVTLGVLAVLALWTPIVPMAQPGTVEAAGEIVIDRWVQTTSTDFNQGTKDGVVIVPLADGGLQLVLDQAQGVYTSTQWEAPFTCQAVGLLYQAQLPPGTRVSFRLRARDQEGELWGPWVEVPAGPWTDPEGRPVGESLLLLDGGDRLQYQAYLYGGDATPVLEEVVLVALGGEVRETVRAIPPWEEPEGLLNPVEAEAWGAAPLETPVPEGEGATEAAGSEEGEADEGEAAEAASEEITDVVSLRWEVRPAALTLQEAVEVAPALQMIDYFYRQVVGLEALPYAFLLDSAGGVYRGPTDSLDDLLYIGIVGAHPHEVVSPTVEDGLVALLDWWGGLPEAQGFSLSLSTPHDPLLAERLQARWQVGNLRRDSWLLPRGGTAPELHEWLLLANPSSRWTRVTARLHQEDGPVLWQTVALPGDSRGSLFVNPWVSEGAFWAEVSAEGEVLVERALYYGHDADDSVGMERLSRVWYLPGGTQEADFTTTLTLVNPWEEAVTATVTVFAPSGVVGEGEVVLEPQGRLDLPLAQVYTGTTPLGSRVSAVAPIAVEQGVWFSASSGGYGLPGSPVLSRDWILASVDTADPSTTLLSLLNPWEETVPITVTLMSEDGTTLLREYALPTGQQVLNVNTILPGLALAAEVRSERPIAAARVTFFQDHRSAYASLGAVQAARRWYLPEGSTAEPFETLLVVANPNPWAVDLKVTFLGERGVLDEVGWSMPASARLTVPLNEVLPDLSAFSTQVVSDWPVVVERIMYLHERQGGHSELGIPR